LPTPKVAPGPPVYSYKIFAPELFELGFSFILDKKLSNLLFLPSAPPSTI
jgi:hypothetical protein